MKRMMIAAALMLSGMAAMPAQAATFVQDGGTPRGLTIASYGTVGQSFTMIGGALESFGFQFQTGLTGSVNGPVTFTLRDGKGLGGAVLKEVTVTPPDAANRTNFWYDFALGGVSLTEGGIYTAALTTTANRLSVIYSPAATGKVDGYAGGTLLTATPIASGNCTTGICDANFRFTSSAASGGAVPEPASWALMLLGFGAIGQALRRKSAVPATRQMV